MRTHTSSTSGRAPRRALGHAAAGLAVVALLTATACDGEDRAEADDDAGPSSSVDIESEAEPTPAPMPRPAPQGVRPSDGAAPGSGSTGGGATAGSADPSAASSDPSDDLAANGGGGSSEGATDDAAADPQLVETVEASLSEGEVAATIDDLGLDIDDPDATYWGVADVFGEFVISEVSGCWVDRATLNAVIELWEIDGLVVGRMHDVSYDGSNPPLHHVSGERCAGGDQGPTSAARDSVEILALGFVDDDGLTLMLEPTDASTYTLASGGDLGTTSFLAQIAPHLLGDSTTGGFTGMTVSHEQLDAGAALVFEGTLTGTGATTWGAVVISIEPGVDPLDPTLEDADYYEVLDRLAEVTAA